MWNLARPQWFMAAFILTLMDGCSAPAPSPPVTPQPGWKLIKNQHFSFAIPDSFKKVDVQGVDSFVEQYEDEGIKLMFDYGMYSNDFSDWPAETKFETIQCGNETAKVGTRESKDLSGVGVITQVYVKENSRHSNLAMGANCRGQNEADLAKAIFKTIRF